jgi:phosphopantothenoylcysteine decarboxylase/phosphopantothenate--cysteine ligase
VLVSGPVAIPAPPEVRRISVESAADMLKAVLGEIDGVDIFISTAAVADYRPADPAGQKIKKVSDSLDVKMERTPDILAAVSARPKRPFVVGFAAETTAVEEHARAKLESKNLDMIAANEVGDGKGFEEEENELLVLWKGGRQELGRGLKITLARNLIALIADSLNKRSLG